MYRFHSEILASLNVNTNKILSPGFENNHTLKCCSGNFPTWSYMSRLLKKKPYQHLNVWLFSNPGDKVQKRRRTTGQICPYFQQESGPCPLDWRITIHSNVDLVFFQQFWHIWLCWKIARTRFQCMVVLQSRGQNFILVEI